MKRLSMTVSALGARMKTQSVIALVFALGIAGCRDGLFVSPAPANNASLAVAYALAPAVAARDAETAFDRVNAVRVRVTGNGVAKDTVLPLSPTAETRVRIPLNVPDGSQVYRIDIELRRGTDVVFEGTTTASLVSGQTTTAEVPVTPVFTAILPGGKAPLLQAFGDTAQLQPIAVFATGDTLRSALLQWSSSNTSVATVTPTGVVKAVGSGVAMITATSGTASLSTAVNVCTSKAVPAYTGARYKFGAFGGVFDINDISTKRTVLWAGGVIFGTSPSDLVSAWDAVELDNQVDWLNGSVCVLQIAAAPGVASAEYTRHAVRITKAPPLPPVTVIQETYTTGGGFVLIRYTFTNTASAAISALRVGMTFEWNLLYGTAGTVVVGNSQWAVNDFTRFDSVLGAAEVFKASGEMAGPASVGSLPIRSYSGAGNSGPRTTGLNTDSLPVTRAQVYNRIASGLSQAAVGPAYIHQYIGFGDLSIPVGQSVSVTIVLAAGDNSTLYAANVALGRQAFTQFPAF